MKNIETTLKYEDILLIKSGDRVYIPCSIDIHFPSYIKINNEDYTIASVVSLNKTTIYHNECIYEILNNEVIVSVEANGCYYTVALHIKDIYRIVSVSALKEYDRRKEHIENILNKELKCSNDYIKDIPNIDDYSLYDNTLKCNILFNKKQLNDYSVGDKITIDDIKGTVFSSYIKNIICVGSTPMLEVFVPNEYVDKLGATVFDDDGNGVLSLLIDSCYIEENLNYSVKDNNNKITNFRDFLNLLKFLRKLLKNQKKSETLFLSKYKFSNYEFIHYVESDKDYCSININCIYTNKKDYSLILRKKIFKLIISKNIFELNKDVLKNEVVFEHLKLLNKTLNKKCF